MVQFRHMGTTTACRVCHGRQYVSNYVDGCYEDCWRCDGTGEHFDCADDCEGCPACIGPVEPGHFCTCDGTHCNG